MSSPPIKGRQEPSFFKQHIRPLAVLGVAIAIIVSLAAYHYHASLAHMMTLAGHQVSVKASSAWAHFTTRDALVGGVAVASLCALGVVLGLTKWGGAQKPMANAATYATPKDYPQDTANQAIPQGWQVGDSACPGLPVEIVYSDEE